VDALATPTIRLSVRLLGRLSIHIDDRPVRITGRQSQALFALLVLRPRSRTREATPPTLGPGQPLGGSPEPVPGAVAGTARTPIG
jgi:hypothetical protein